MSTLRNCREEGELLNSLNGCLNCLENGIQHPVEIKYNFIDEWKLIEDFYEEYEKIKRRQPK